MRIGRYWGRTWVAKFFGASATHPLAWILNSTMIWMTKTRKTHTNTGNQVFHHRYDPRLARPVHLLGLQLNNLRTSKKTHRQRNLYDPRLTRPFKALSQFYQKLALDIHIMSLWTIGDHYVLLDISVERTTINVYDSRGSQLEIIHPFIEALNKAYEKFKSRSKKHHELGRSRFRVVSAGSIQMQPTGNDLYGFYVMHYMRNLINALSGSQVWPLSPFSKFG
ncbi:unnamed protein product [Miscanthus lutarioriparius]|uniref:Uncharacterized protein n=1 Tax=Miscanthus lutarioriparius TaxID=422564 RepID=A0A811PQD1_9POAL|nr:unnamed protein product [Miscanthus lutarioriparius]